MSALHTAWLKIITVLGVAAVAGAAWFATTGSAQAATRVQAAVQRDDPGILGSLLSALCPIPIVGELTNSLLHNCPPKA